MASSSWIPWETMEDILCRVPAYALVRFKTVCKQWKALFSDKRFVEKHLAHARVYEQFLVCTRSSRYTLEMDPCLGVRRNNLSGGFGIEGKALISYMAHCDGLFLCSMTNLELVVWNPCLNQARWIEPLFRPYKHDDYYGLGYNNKSWDGYKIVSYSYHREAKIDGFRLFMPFILIFDLSSNSWRCDIFQTFRRPWSMQLSRAGVSVKGNCYWIASWDDTHEPFTLYFDFSTDRFEVLCGFPFSYNINDNVVVLDAFRGDRLSVLNQCQRTKEIEIWATSRIGTDEKVSWSMFMKVTTPASPALNIHYDLARQSYLIDKNDKLVICGRVEETEEEEEEEEAQLSSVVLGLYAINEGDDEFKRVELERFCKPSSMLYRVCGYSYVPSLVQIENHVPVPLNHAPGLEPEYEDIRGMRLRHLY